MTTVDCRLMCAASTAYGIDPKSGSFTPRQPEYDAVGYIGSPTAISGGTDLIDACLVGRSGDGIVVAFRGTLSPALTPASITDWIQDFLAEPKVVANLPGKVHSGFYDATDAIYGQVAAATKALVAANPGAPLYVTGHSKGGPMASLFAMMLHADRAPVPAPRVVTFASPKPGDAAFAEGYNAAISQTGYENYLDLVPFMPPDSAFIALLAEIPWIGPLFDGAKGWDYTNVGKRLYIQANGTVVPATPALDDLRVAEIAGELVVNYDNVVAAHCSECKGKDCAGGYLRGTCQGVVCGH